MAHGCRSTHRVWVRCSVCISSLVDLLAQGQRNRFVPHVIVFHHDRSLTSFLSGRLRKVQRYMNSDISHHCSSVGLCCCISRLAATDCRIAEHATGKQRLLGSERLGNIATGVHRSYAFDWRTGGPTLQMWASRQMRCEGDHPNDRCVEHACLATSCTDPVPPLRSFLFVLSYCGALRLTFSERMARPLATS